MWQIRLYSMSHFWDKKFSELPLIKEVELEPDKYALLEIDGKTYRWCASDHENKVLGVKEVKINHDPEDEEEDEDLRCPYCGSVESDAWEYKEDSDTIHCNSCNSKIEYERNYEVSYKVMPVKLAEIIKL